ncbi:MAG TPA: ATP-binding protein [Candidatus Acidoferrum sp.]|nr:ATP-binding protein [Candidatus Acidoferrum sp.]
MDRPKSSPRGRPLFYALVLVLVGFHVLLLVAAPHFPASPLIAGLLQLALSAVAVGAAWQESHHSAGFSRAFWRFQACGFSLWVLAQTLATIYDAVLHRPVSQPWPSDLLFFLWTTPAFLALFLDPYAASQRIPWTRWLDFAQVGILVTSVYTFAFEVPSHWQSRTISYEQLALLVSFARDIFLVACFTFRALRSHDRQVRSLYGRMAIFLALYSLAECPYLYLQVYERLRPGTLWDLPFSLALAAATTLIITSPIEAVDQGQRLPDRKKSSQRIALKLVPLVFPMAVLLMSAHIAEQQFAIAVAAVLLSFACSSARIVLTERQQLRSEAALDQKNALVKSVFEGTGDAIFVKDSAGSYLIVNEMVARFFDKPIDKIIGKTAFQLTDLMTAKTLTEHDREILDSGTSLTVDFQTTRDGQVRHFLVTRSPYRDSNGNIIGVIGVSRDISDYKKMEERLRQSQKMEAIGTLAGGVAHDFNNILMVISGYSSVLTDALASEPKLRGHVEQIQKAGERAASLTRQLLAFSRKQTIQPTPLNLNNVVTGIEKLLHRVIGENIVISTHLALELGTVMADAGQIEQVLLNLAVNARDAMPDGGTLSIETRNTVSANGKSQGSSGPQPREYVELIVSDSGVGMDPAIQAHIFEPFFTTKAAGKGTGLGLSTVYGIVQQAGGSVTFQSAPGAGTSFRVLLPRIPYDASTEVSQEERATKIRGGETVLLVEDDASVCELVRAVLASQGYSVLAARRPQEAEAICRVHASRIQLLLTDVIMPEMSGAELSKRLTALNPQLRVLFMSGYIDDFVVRQGIRERGIAYLQKPFSPASLAKKVREVLDSAPVR